MEIKSRVRTCDSAAWNSVSTIKHGISLALPLMKLPKLLSRFSFLRRTPLQHQLIQTMCSYRKISIQPPPPPTPTESNGNSEGRGSKRRQFRGGRVVASRGLCSGSPSKIGELLTAVLFIVSWQPLILLLISVSQQSYCFHL